MSRIAEEDIRTNTGKNCHKLKEEFKLDPLTASSAAFQKVYKFYELADAEKWRLPQIESLMKEKYEMSVCGEETEEITRHIESLCYS